MNFKLQLLGNMVCPALNFSKILLYYVLLKDFETLWIFLIQCDHTKMAIETRFISCS